MAVVVEIGQLLLADGDGDRLALTGLQFDAIEADELTGWAVADVAAGEADIDLNDLGTLAVARVCDGARSLCAADAGV